MLSQFCLLPVFILVLNNLFHFFALLAVNKVIRHTAFTYIEFRMLFIHIYGSFASQYAVRVERGDAKHVILRFQLHRTYATKFVGLEFLAKLAQGNNVFLQYSSIHF